MRYCSLFWLYIVKEKPQNLMPKDLIAPWWCLSRTRLKVWDWAKWKKRGSQTRMCIHVLVLLLHISMDSMTVVVWGKEAMCPLHHHGNLQNQWWINRGWTGAFSTLVGSNQPWITTEWETSGAAGQPELGEAWRSLYKQPEHTQPYVALVNNHPIPF